MEVLVCVTLGGVVALGGVAVGMKGMKGKVKSSAFECGFIAYDNSRSSFSVQFFLVSLVFLIFDVELVLLFPFIKSSGGEIILGVFVGVLTLGLFVEWFQEMLDWYK